MQITGLLETVKILITSVTVVRAYFQQTPQVFRRQLLLDAYAGRDGFEATDEAQVVERMGHPVSVINGSPLNLKIATKEDQRLAEQALKALPKPKLSGPAHPFAGDDIWR